MVSAITLGDADRRCMLLDTPRLGMSTDFDQISDVKAYFESESDPERTSLGDSPESTEDATTLADMIMFPSSINSKRDLIQKLPPKPELDRYVAAWFNAMDPTRGETIHRSQGSLIARLTEETVVTHVPTFQQQVR